MEENQDHLCQQAGELGKLGVPVIIFQEGNLSDVTHTFQQIARVSGGVYLGFDLAGIAALRPLLAGIAVFATGGLAALENYAAKHGGEVLRLSAQLGTAR
jgi:hypothetical protein